MKHITITKVTGKTPLLSSFRLGHCQANGSAQNCRAREAGDNEMMPKIWLSAIAFSLLLTYFNFCWINGAIQPLAISLIFFSAVAILLWRKRDTITLNSDLFSSLLGTLLIAIALLKICSLTGVSRTLNILPLIAALGLALLASGIKGLKQYWQELTLLLALTLPGANFFLWWLKLGWLNHLIQKNYPVSQGGDLKLKSVSYFNSFVKSTQLWLLCLAISLTTIYLHSLSIIQGISVLDHSILALLAVFWLLWQKREQINSQFGYQFSPNQRNEESKDRSFLNSQSHSAAKGLSSALPILNYKLKIERLHPNRQIYSHLLGTACLAFSLSKTFSGAGIWLQTLPFFSALGMALIVSGLTNIKKYWRELVILSIIVIFGAFKHPMEEHFALTTISAQFSHFLLEMGGIDSIRQGTLIAFSPETAINVVESCAGYSKIFWLVEISIIYLMLFPSNRINILIVPAVAAAIAFIANGIRIAILGVFLAFGNQARFEYWHHGEGSQIFTIIPLIIFGSFCLYLIKQIKPEERGE